MRLHRGEAGEHVGDRNELVAMRAEVVALVDVLWGVVAEVPAAQPLVHAGNGQRGHHRVPQVVGVEDLDVLVVGAQGGECGVQRAVEGGDAAGVVDADAGDEPGGGVDHAGVGVGVEDPDDLADQVGELGRHGNGAVTAGLGVGLAGGAAQFAVVAPDERGLATLAGDGQPHPAAVFGDVVDGQPVGLADAQPDHSHQPQRQLEHRGQVPADRRDLGQVHKPRWLRRWPHPLVRQRLDRLDPIEGAADVGAEVAGVVDDRAQGLEHGGLRGGGQAVRLVGLDEQPRLAQPHRPDQVDPVGGDRGEGAAGNGLA